MLSIIQAAGWPIWPLIACSVVALALIAERFYSLRPSRVHPAGLLDQTIAACSHSLPGVEVTDPIARGSVLGELLATSLRARASAPDATEDALRAEVERAGRQAAHRLERYLSALGTIASAAPLLGLLGTVIGMIEIFGSQAPTAGGGVSGNPAQLAHGISVALYNTAFGLIVAIPALMFWRYFRARVDAYILQLELASERFVRHLLTIKA